MNQPQSQDAILRREIITRELARRDLETFVARMTPHFAPGPHITAICKAVQDLEAAVQEGKRGAAVRLIVEAPPRHGKTQIISHCTPLWYLGRHPDQEIIVATFNQDRADELGRWCKGAVDDPLFRTVFPDLNLRSDSKAANRIGTNKGGGIKFAGVGTAITGSGANCVVVDDSCKDAEQADSETESRKLWDWYSSVLRTRLHPKAGIIVLQTRWRANDLIGRLREAMETGKGEDFKVLTLRALAEEDDVLGRAVGEPLHPARYDAESLANLRKSMLPRDWMAMFQQRPLEETGAIFKPSDFQLYKPGSMPKNVYWHVACDGAFSTRSSADHSVIWPYAVDSDGVMWFSPDFLRARIDVSVFLDELVRRLVDYKAASLTLEAGGFYRAIEPELKRRLQQAGVYVQINTPPATKDKFARSRPLHARMVHGTAKWPDVRTLHEIVIPEFLAFTGKNDRCDDLIDTAAWAAFNADRAVKPYTTTDEDPDEFDLRPSGHTNLWNMADIEARTPTRSAPKNRYAPPSLR